MAIISQITRCHVSTDLIQTILRIYNIIRVYGLQPMRRRRTIINARFA